MKHLMLLVAFVLVSGPAAWSQQSFIRGDVNDDGITSLPDAIVLLGFLFTPGAGPIGCLDSADTNDDGALGLPDGVVLLSHLFSPGSLPPAQPYPACGGDPTPDALECDGPLVLCPVIGTPSFAWPMPGDDADEWVINNYVDLQPGGGILDYMGGNKTYNGHNGIDIDVPTFRAMDDDFPILAAAPGVVVDLEASNYDRNTSCTGSWNFVSVEHANGWRSIYGHLKQYSVVVEVGQTVETGDVLGVVGSSGCSTAPHLHFEVRDQNNQVVPPFEQGLWQAPPVYDTPFGFMDAVLYRQPITNVDMIKDPPQNVDVAPPGGTLGIGLSMAGGGPGDTITIQIRRPDESILASNNFNFGQVYRHSFWWWNYGVPANVEQDYHSVQIRLNGVLVHSYTVFFGPVYNSYQQVRHGIPIANYQAEFDALVANGYRPVWFDGFQVNGGTYCNFIFVQSSTNDWAMAHGMTGSEYQDFFEDQVAAGRRLIHVESYRQGSTTRYAAIFLDAIGYLWTGYHGVPASAHNAVFQDLASQGYRCKVLSTVNVSGTLYFTALWDTSPTSSWLALAGMTEADYQVQFDANVAAGRTLRYLNHYQIGNSPRFVAIWDGNVPSSWAAVHGVTGAQFQDVFDDWTAAGLLTRIVTGYQDGAIANYGGLWTN